MLTETIDVAQVVLYAFWFFFFGLIFWLRREDRREGYPLEGDKSRQLNAVNPVLIPPAKTFILPHGGDVQAPSFARDGRPMMGERTSRASGAPLQPTGDPLLSGVGPASYADRADIVETTREGYDLIVPMRAAPGYSVNAGPDPRGWKVVAADGNLAGLVTDIWLDKADLLVRYLEVELATGPMAGGVPAGRRLIPVPMLRIQRDKRHVKVHALLARQFASVPTTKEPDRVTLLEEERIGAFYAGGKLYAEPKRLGPKL